MSSWMSCYYVFLKEFKDALRDRRSVLSALLFPLLMPLLIGAMFHLLVERETSSAAVSVPVLHQERAPLLMEHLASRQIVVLAAAAPSGSLNKEEEREVAGEALSEPQADARAPELRALREQIAKGEQDILLEISSGYSEAMKRGEPALVRLFYDASRSDSSRKARSVQRALAEYSQQLVSLRLIAQGVSPELTLPIQVEDHDLSTPSKLTAQLLSLIPMLALMGCFVGSMQVAIDTTAGERERGSLEPLLLNPVSRISLIAGKWAAAVLFGAVSASLTLALCVITMSFVELSRLGLYFEPSAAQVAAMWVVVLPVSLLAAGLQMLVAMFARSYKEAQTYLSFVMFLPMLPGLLLTFSQDAMGKWGKLIPIAGQTQFLSDIIGGGSPEPLALALNSVFVALLGFLCVFGAARLMMSERVIFGR